MNFQPLKDFLDYYLPMLGIPGSDTVIYKDHEEIFRYTAGADSIRLGTPMRKDLLYNIYSCTKVATAIAATQLIERGELVVSDPVYANIPEFRNLTVKVRDSQGRVIGVKPAEKTMTIEQLLTMTSGLDYVLQRPAVKKVFADTNGRAPTLDVCRALAADPLEFEPGDDYCYSLSLDVMGGIIELVSGMSVAEYMRENIFLPLGMKDTGFKSDATSRFATQYRYDAATGSAVEIPFDEVIFRFGTEYESAGAGLITSVDDYILIADALANGGVGKNGNRILSSYGVELLRANKLNEKQLATYAVTHNRGYGYGYGVRVNMTPETAGNLAPRGDFGWDGAKLCYLSADPTSRVALFHAEHMGGLANVVIPRLRNLVYSCLDY